MRILVNKKQFHKVIKNVVVEEIDEVSIYDDGEHVYLKIGETYYDTKHETFDILRTLYVKGYADLTSYEEVKICLGY